MLSLQQDLGVEYYNLERGEILDRITKRKQELADNLLILCHHYQQQDIFQFADLAGDSLKLAKEAAAISD
ncbi:MAG: quinolinate synthase NadA, partial [Desulfocapsa sp.]|nr:quinolinate synthase NadA [Desulfocapsa sp.]